MWFSKMKVIKGKVEDVELPEKADILISEPMGKIRITVIPLPLPVTTISLIIFYFLQAHC